MVVGTGVYVLFCLSLLIVGTDGTIFKYDNLNLENNVLKFRSAYMYSTETSPGVDSRHPESYIKFDFTFTLNNEKKNHIAQVTIFPGVPTDFLGANHKYCCSREDVHDGVCSVVNELFIPTAVDREVFLLDFDEGEEIDGTLVLDMSGTYFIKEKGIYTIMFSFCQPDSSSVSISGTAAWKNPYGYLPGELYGFLSFFGSLLMGYWVVAIVWGYMCAKNWRDLLTLQICITVVLGLGMIEVILRYYDFHSLNHYGLRNHALMLAGVTFATIKKTVSRMLVLVVGMGYGVVKPNLGEVGNKVAILGFVYLIVASVQHTVENLSMHSDNGELTSFPKLALLLPVAALDTYFYFWIFRSIRTTVTQLESRGQEAKLELYVRFQRVLQVSVVVTSIWAVLYIFVRVFQFKQFEWEHVYILDGFWDCLYLAILVAIMYLWRPNKNNQRYAYSQVKTSDDEEYGEKLEDHVGNGKTPEATSSNELAELVAEKPVIPKSD